MTRPQQPSGGRMGRVVVWTAGLAVALGSAVATAHGLFEVALAARVPAGIAWLYPLITDGLALVAYTATARLTGRAARYAWAVVVLAAGLSGLAQAAFLAADPTAAVQAPAPLRFGIGAWPAIAAAIAAHLLYLLLDEHPTEQIAEPAVQPAAGGAASSRSAVQPPPSNPPAVQPGSQPRPALPGPGAERPAASDGPAADAPARTRARVAALRHAARHGALPTVSALAETADVSRGTAATVLKPLRAQPLPLHLITTSADDQPDTTEEHSQP